jgi:hypothetical protein
MKHFIFILAATISLVNNGFAQSKNSKSKSRFGVKAGYNYINTSNISSIGGSNTSGFHAGVFASGEDENIKASSDLLFSKQGYKYKSGKVDMNYLTTTETADFFVVEDIFKVQIGLHIGYLLSAKADSSGVSFNNATKKPSDYFNRFSFGIAGGAEFISEPGVLIGMRYTIGINNIMKKQETNNPVPAFLPSSSDASIKSNLFQLYAGFRF